MVDPPTYRAEPDPEFAERLERVLLQRLTAPVGSRPGAARSDAPLRTAAVPGDHEEDILWLDIQDRPTGDDLVAARRSPGRWLLVAAAAVLIAVVGTLLVTAGGDRHEDQVPATSIPTSAPTTSTSTTSTVPGSARDMMDLADQGDIVPVAPGRYFLDPDNDDATPLRVTYEIAPRDWEAWFGVVKLLVADESQSTGLSVATVTNLATDGCLDPTPLDPPVGPTVDDLATALSQLAPFEVAAAPTDVTLLGYEGKHLVLSGPTTDVACLDADPYNRTTPINGGSFSGDDGPGLTVELWILDVEGTRLVLGKFDTPQSSAQDLAERDAVFDTLHIEP